MHYGSYSTAFRATLISYGNKKTNPLFMKWKEKTYRQKFPRTSIMSHGNKALLFQFLNPIIAIKNATIAFLDQVLPVES